MGLEDGAAASLENTPRAYRAWLQAVLTACRRVARDGVVLLPGPMNVVIAAEALEAAGLRPMLMLRWAREPPFRPAAGPTAEPILWATKGRRRGAMPARFRASAEPIVVTEPGGASYTDEHPSPKPLELMRRLVALSVPRLGTVIDPFAGTGTTLQAARDLDRNTIGIELEESFCSLAERRLEERPRGRSGASPLATGMEPQGRR